MTVKINQILNTGILNAEWIGFHGDSEYEDKDGEWHLGAWSFIGVTTNPRGEIPWELDDEVEEEALYNPELTFVIRNKRGKICLVKFHYRRDEDEYNNN